MVDNRSELGYQTTAAVEVFSVELLFLAAAELLQVNNNMTRCNQQLINSL